MTDEKIVQALRCCAEGECKDCSMHEDKQRCQENLLDKAAEAIERLTAENAALKKEIRKAGCMFCARFGDCTEGFKPTDQEDCDNCAKKPDCACMKCSGIGSSTDNWEWRGISGMPVLPNEGGLSLAPGSLGAEGEQARNEPLTLQELVELNGQPVWMGEPFNKWAIFEIDSKNIQEITPEMKIRKGLMNVNGEIVEVPPVNFYRKPIKKMSSTPEEGEKA